jgi:hypothetical protein
LLSLCIVIPTFASQRDDIQDLITDSDPFALAMIMEKIQRGPNPYPNIFEEIKSRHKCSGEFYCYLCDVCRQSEKLNLKELSWL